MGFQSKIVPEAILRVEDVTVNFSGIKALSLSTFRRLRRES